MQLIGQKANLDVIQKWSKMPNFIIIQGEEHTGKNYLVLYLCSLFKLHYSKIPISVKSVRDSVRLMSPDANIVYHFDNFDEASIQAKNALLKITEEPIPGNYIVITGKQQLATLQSRARIIIMAPYSFEELEELLVKNYTNIDPMLLYNAGINTPAKIEYYKKYEQINDILEMAYHIYERITYIDVIDYINIINKFDYKYEKDSIDSCELFLNMLLSILENKMLESNKFSFFNIIQIITKIKYQLKREDTLNRRMLIFRMFYQIQLSQSGDIK